MIYFIINYLKLYKNNITVYEIDFLVAFSFKGDEMLSLKSN